MDYKVFWSNEALRNLDEILKYLKLEWTEREILQFKTKLADQLEIIKKYPFIFPKSDRNPRLRKAVLSKHTIIFYEVQGYQLNLVYLFQTRMNPNKII